LSKHSAYIRETFANMDIACGNSLCWTVTVTARPLPLGVRLLPIPAGCAASAVRCGWAARLDWVCTVAWRLACQYFVLVWSSLKLLASKFHMSLCSNIVEDLRIRIRNLIAAMVKEKGLKHAHVVQQEEPKTPGESTKVKCKYCELVFTTTTTRICAHLLGWTRSGVRACDKVPPVVTHQLEELEKEKKEKEFKKRKVEQLDKLSSGEAVKPKK